MIVLNRTDVLIVLEQLYDVEGNCAIIYTNNGSEIIMEKKPSFHTRYMDICLSMKNIDGKEIIEYCHIPYENISYIITTTFENMKLKMENYVNNVFD